MKDTELLRRIRGGRCTVLGYGVSNRPLVDWLAAHGAASVTVRDKCPASDMESSGGLARLAASGAYYIGGADYLEGLVGEADVIFRSPGIRPDTFPIPDAVAAGAVLTSEMELFLDLTDARVIGVTGSDGKTTSTTITSLLVDASLKRQGKGRMYLGGNIGTPLLPLVDGMTADDVAVVELSSFQLMTVTRAPERAAVTNLSPNHLNWHTDMAEYIAAKTNICTHEPISTVVLNAGNDLTRALGESLPDDLPIIWFSASLCGRETMLPPSRRLSRDAAVYESDGTICLEAADGTLTKLLDTARIRLPGRHNIENFMTALALTQGISTPADAAQVADAFGGVPHRLELVRERRGVRFYNSSIDSSPSRTCAALAAMEDLNARRGGEKPILICGGQDKHVPFDPLAEALCAKAKAVILTGEARGLILNALERCPDYDPEKLPVTVIPDWDEAMTAACRMAQPGDAVLLSPACTSFDAFKNFEARGSRFRDLVLSLD